MSETCANCSKTGSETMKQQPYGTAAAKREGITRLQLAARQLDIAVHACGVEWPDAHAAIAVRFKVDGDELTAAYERHMEEQHELELARREAAMNEAHRAEGKQ